MDVADPSIELELPEPMLWVKDAPFFIDEVMLRRFYDATVRPTFKKTEVREIELTEAQLQELKGKIEANAKLGTSSWVGKFFNASASIDASGSGGAGTSSIQNSTYKASMELIETPERQLEQLLSYYLVKYTDRLLIGNLIDAAGWSTKAHEQPRGIVVLDLKPGVKLIPMAAEFNDGQVSTFYDKMEKPSGERAPKGSETPELWAWMSDNFDPNNAMLEVERAAEKWASRPQWIDFRVPLDNKGHTMHVHIEARGEFHTGNFAYRLIRRSFGHGVRIIGTLKDGPDINVLAMYEK